MRIPSPTSCVRHQVLVSSSDVAWVIVSPALALWLRDADLLSHTWVGASLIYCVVSALFSIVGLFIFRVQDGMARYFSVHDAIDIAKAVVFAEFVTCVILFSLTRLDGIPRSMPLIHGLLLATGLVAGRMFARMMHGEDPAALGYQFRRDRIILIGANRLSAFFIELIHSYPPDGQRVIAVLDDRPEMLGRAIGGVKVLGAPGQLEAIVKEFAIHGVYAERAVIAGEEDLLSPEVMREIQLVCEQNQIDLAFLPRLIGITEWKHPPLAAAATSSTSMPGGPPFALPSFFWFKRAIDLGGSLALFVLLCPLMMMAALLVLVDVGPPVLFWQQRLGRHRRPFLMYKFRTLRPPFDGNGDPIPDGVRMSAIGRILRASRIDELPQLLNVLIGDMSLIGPRPLLPEDQPANASVRLSVRPGITGWAQVNGGKLVTKERKEKLDEWYVRNASPWTDLRIMFMTFAYVLGSTTSSPELLADAELVKNRNSEAYPKAVVLGCKAGEKHRRAAR
jgi:lipopolysaccharide/colanic/teichoic acid biosynthesis glycosyltransferase